MYIWCFSDPGADFTVSARISTTCKGHKNTGVHLQTIQPQSFCIKIKQHIH